MSTLETNLIQPSTGTSLTLGASRNTITIPFGATGTVLVYVSRFWWKNSKFSWLTSTNYFSCNTSTKIQF